MERELVQRAMHGDEEAFDTLVGLIGDSMHSVARRILRDTTLAQDATQQALLDAWRNLPTLRDPDRFEAWTHRLLVNACYAEARRERRHRGDLRLLGRDEVDPDAASRIATQDQLDRGFRRLSVEHRTVVVLVHYLGLTPTEAAERMGTPPERRAPGCTTPFNNCARRSKPMRVPRRQEARHDTPTRLRRAARGVPRRVRGANTLA